MTEQVTLFHSVKEKKDNIYPVKKTIDDDDDVDDNDDE